MAIKLGDTTADIVRQINDNESNIAKKANLSGGNTFLGTQIIDGYLDIRGTAAEKHLKTRGIGGSDGKGNESDLYLQYSSNYRVRFGKSGQSSLNSDGSISVNGKTVATVDDIDDTKHSAVKLTNENLANVVGKDKVGWYYADYGNTCTGLPRDNLEGFPFSLEVGLGGIQNNYQATYQRFLSEAGVWYRQRQYNGYTNWTHFTDSAKHTQTSLSADANLNNYYGGEYSIGWYDVIGGVSVQNAPYNASKTGFSFEVLQSGNYWVQRAIVNADGKMYSRLRQSSQPSGSWTKWNEVVDCTNDQEVCGDKSFGGVVHISPDLSNKSEGDDNTIFSIDDGSGCGDTIFGVRYDGGGNDTATVLLGAGCTTAPLEVGNSVGTAGQVLMSQGEGKTPKWGDISGLVQIRVQTSQVYSVARNTTGDEDYYINLNIAIIGGKDNLRAGDMFKFCQPTMSKEWAGRRDNPRKRRRWRAKYGVDLDQATIDSWTDTNHYPIVLLPVRIGYYNSETSKYTMSSDLLNSNTWGNSTTKRIPWIVRVQRKVYLEAQKKYENRTISNHCQVATMHTGDTTFTAERFDIYNYSLRPL